jgi:hypothetical protein
MDAPSLAGAAVGDVIAPGCLGLDRSAVLNQLATVLAILNYINRLAGARRG